MSLSLALTLVLAWPVDMVHDVEVGKEKFVKLASIDWVESDDPSTVTAEVMESGEVLLTGVKKGRALVLLHAEGKFAVWRVRSGSPPLETALEPAQKACPDLKLAADGRTRLLSSVPSDACWSALHTLFQADRFVARELDLNFDGKVLQTQLKSIQAALPKQVASKYVGAGVVLDGRVTEAERRKILWLLFKKSVGRVALDDHLEIAAP